MKRSEMVVNLAISLMSRLPEMSKEDRRDFASELLQVLEIDGMIPPNQYACTNEFRFEWESEDD